MKKREIYEWFALDHVAKIFPPSSTKQDPRVFRFSSSLDENIQVSVLKEATEKVLNCFPSFQVVLKKGFFWYYLEHTDMKPIIEEETDFPCRELYQKNCASLLFKVLYFKNRIHLEMYHAIADGKGALAFFKTLLFYYICLRAGEKNMEPFEDVSLVQRNEDAFKRYCKFVKKRKKTKRQSVYQIKGEKLENGMHVIEGFVKKDELLAICKAYKVTVTEFIVSVYIYAIAKSIEKSEVPKTISIMVPVDLRKYYKSATLRNFFCTISVSYTVNSTSLNFTHILNTVRSSFHKQLHKKNIAVQMHSYQKIERSLFIRAIPLFFKNIILKIGCAIGGGRTTSIVTNLGVVELPDICKDHIKSVSVLVSTQKMQMSICSYQNAFSIVFTSLFKEKEIIKNFYQKLSFLGLYVKVFSNKVGEM